MERVRRYLRPTLLLLPLAGCVAGTGELVELGQSRDGGNGGCIRLPPVITTGAISRPVGPGVGPVVAVMDGEVYYDSEGRLYALRAPNGEPRQLMTREYASLMAANDGAVLYVGAAEIMGSTFSIFYWREDDGVHSELAPHGQLQIDTQDAYAGRSARQIDRYAAVWLDGSLALRYDLARDYIESDGVCFEVPDLRDLLSAYVFQDQDRPSVALRGMYGGFEGTGGGDSYYPVLGDTLLFYIQEGKLMSRTLEGNARQELHAGPCGPPFADGDRVVAACGGTLGDSPTPGRFIAYWDGVRTHELFEDGGYLFAPRLHEGRIAFIRYTSIDVLCTPTQNPAGEVELWDGAEVWALGKVGAPCLCCGAQWPAARLTFSGDVVAWNYALSESGELTGIGWAHYAESEQCTP